MVVPVVRIGVVWVGVFHRVVIVLVGSPRQDCGGVLMAVVIIVHVAVAVSHFRRIE